MAIDLSKFILRFIEEARDHIQRLHTGLSQLAIENANQTAIIHDLFRSAHTIKGSSRMLKLTTITELAHQLEDVLSALREQQVDYHPNLGALLYSTVDALASLVDQLSTHQDATQLKAVDAGLLTALAATVAHAPTPVVTATPTQAEQPPRLPTADTPAQPIAHEQTQLQLSETVRVRLNKLDELLSLMGEMITSHSVMQQRLHDIQQLTHAADNHGTITGIQQFVRQFKSDVQQQEMQINELLDKTLIMRMLPLSSVFDPVTSIVRELAQSIGKQAQCLIQGGDIEIDRQLIDKLSDPLVHLIRNALDHGIETPAARQQQGKPIQGKIQIQARQEGGWVIIDITDDGQGINLTNVKDKAIRKQLISTEEAEQLSDTEIIDFIFLPGFSTNHMITDLSGRGVGMDVVKKTIVDDLQGSISVQTSTQGTQFSLRMPLSLAMMRVLIVEAAGQQYGFTTQHVSELLHLDPQQIREVAERKTFILRNEFIPIIALTDFLGLTETQNSTNLLLVVLRLRNEKLALIVDHLLDEHDMVIKPLPSHLQYLKLISGMVSNGKNQLIPILQATEFFNLARQAKQQKTSVHAIQQQAPLPIVPNVHHILVVDDSLNTREIEKDVLEAQGYRVSLAEDGMDGLKKARAGDFDAILTDVEMPHMDGFTLTAQLRQEEKYRHRPIIIITSREKEEDKRRGMQVGADAYIVKGGFEQNTLIDTLKALLG